MNITRKLELGLLAISILAIPCTVAAQEAVGAEGDLSPLRRGAYVAPMAQYIFSDGDSGLDDGMGGVLSVGWRNDSYAWEIGGFTADLDGTTEQGVMLNGLLFPFSSLPSLYAVAGGGGLSFKDYPGLEKRNEPSTAFAQAGVGFLFPVQFGNYEFAVRAESLYRYGKRERRQNDADQDFPIPNYFNDVLVNVGLQLPLGFKQPPAPLPPPVAVVEPAKICSDTLDNDGDGQIDFPNDPGCAAADDNDETDPAVCSDGKDNDGDGMIDFPSDKGCTAADDNDEVDPCKTPAPGERISLKGCGLGDVIVLRGVNFEFDKARLTANAKTILDNVAEELTAYPEIEVELSGHTDAKGSDEYNQVLSDKRAAAVKRYLVGKDIADTRMTTVGQGESQPVADNETDEGRELNRRVELKVTKGVAPGGPAVTSEPAAPEAPAADAAPADPAMTDGATPDAPAAEAEAAAVEPAADAVAP